MSLMLQSAPHRSSFSITRGTRSKPFQHSLGLILYQPRRFATSSLDMSRMPPLALKTEMTDEEMAQDMWNAMLQCQIEAALHPVLPVHVTHHGEKRTRPHHRNGRAPQKGRRSLAHS